MTTSDHTIKKPKLLDQMRDRIRLKQLQYSPVE